MSEELGTLEDLEILEQVFLDVERARLRRSLYAFLEEMWDVVEPSQPFCTNWHIEVMCQTLQDIATGKESQNRWIFNISPGTLKSLLIGVIFPAWIWARDSKKRFATFSYGQHLTIRDNLRVRDIIQSAKFQKLFPITLVEDQNTKTRFNTKEGGWRIASSVDGVGTGEHPDYIIIDDPTTATQAQSEPERAAANNWFDRTISSRGVARGVTIIVVMQRLHQDDLTGHLLRKGGWGHVRFPMRFEKCACPGPIEAIKEDQRCILHKADPHWTPDPRDPRAESGELMFPALFNETKVRLLELDLGPYGAAGQLQQRPAPEGGGLFKREWFSYVDTDQVPTLVRRVRGWDTAGTEKGGDWTVGVKMCEGFAWVPSQQNPRVKELKSTGQFYIEHVVRDQLGPAGVDALILSTAQADGKACPQREEKDPGAGGKVVIAARTKLLVGYDYGFNALGANKVIRAKPLRAQCEAGNVHLVRGPWNEAFVSELCNFPTGTYDDQVDGASCAFNAILLEPPPRQTECTW